MKTDGCSAKYQWSEVVPALAAPMTMKLGSIRALCSSGPESGRDEGSSPRPARSMPSDRVPSAPERSGSGGLGEDPHVGGRDVHLLPLGEEHAVEPGPGNV